MGIQPDLIENPHTVRVKTIIDSTISVITVSPRLELFVINIGNYT